MKKICVFAGSKEGKKESYRIAAQELGKCLALNGKTIIYGGGSLGLMGLLADSALLHKGTVEGVITSQLDSVEVSHKDLSKLDIVETMHERKALMAKRSEAIICLPGGVGTWEEFFEAMAWNQLGIHSKPIILLNISNYYKDLYDFIKKSVDEKFLPLESLEDLYLVNNIDESLKVIDNFTKRNLKNWVLKIK